MAILRWLIKELFLLRAKYLLYWSLILMRYKVDILISFLRLNNYRYRSISKKDVVCGRYDVLDVEGIWI
jgi:hypothetical protein